jgi:hypothetical protein
VWRRTESSRKERTTEAAEKSVDERGRHAFVGGKKGGVAAGIGDEDDEIGFFHYRRGFLDHAKLGLDGRLFSRLD